MKEILQEIGKLGEYKTIMQAIESGKQVVSAYGMPLAVKANFAAAIFEKTARPMLVVCRDETQAKKFADDFEQLCGASPAILPSREFSFHNIENASREFEITRISALDVFSRAKKPIMFASAEALMTRTIPQKALKLAALTLAADHDYSMDEITRKLIMAGYSRAITVEGGGQFSVRGGILDIFPAGAKAPVRAEFFGDTVDSLGEFDVLTQRRTKNVKTIRILPARETLPQLADGGAAGLIALLEKACARKNATDELRNSIQSDISRLQNEGLFPACDRYMPLIYGPMQTALDYLPKDTIIIVDESAAIKEISTGFAFRMGEDISSLLQRGTLVPAHCDFYNNFEKYKSDLSAHQTLVFDNFLTSGGGFAPQELASITAKQLPSYGGSLDTAISDIENYLNRGYKIAVLAGGPQRMQNMEHLLEERGIAHMRTMGEETHAVHLLEGFLSAGFELPDIKFVVLCDGAILQRRNQKSAVKKKATNRDRVKSFADLVPGDYIVHEHHGVGRFVAIERITADNITRDYLKLAFSGADCLYVPATALDLVSKYIGAPEDSNIRLSKLGGATWAKQKTRAKKAARDLADELIRLYAARRETQGIAFLPDDDWQRSFEEAFPYDETDDQLTCTSEIKHDMQQPMPMDRLLCGDVGFGKTEVAFRAVMKCILSGRQAAILVPTTVLARQHFLTACSRFAGYPLKIDTLSRFRTPKQQKDTLNRLHSGEIDLIIGTHRMLQKDVHFKKLGLLVVDEEQRFGVSHKEQIKKMTENVDILTLTATPIPRTLNMALSGIRDMSVLEEAPQDRQPVQTYVLEYDKGVVLDAIRKELSRGGQVYYLHNRIDSIDRTAAILHEAFPEISIGIAHGRLSESELSQVMTRTYNGEINVLVCTTIIETGIDIANANTLIIEDADYMGLSQLHQIRGRIGRSHRHAFAYLTYRRGKVLSEISQKRLSAIREFAEFGSGFKIAMRDLEIRGAGNVLGAEQSGHMMSVGYDLYLKLLEEAVGEASGSKKPQRTECSADLLVSASLPQSYVPDSGQRVDLYRRIALIRSREDYEDRMDEMIDRYGEPPKQATALLDIALLRARACECGISEINQREQRIMITLQPKNITIAAVLCAMPQYKGRMLLSAGAAPYIALYLAQKKSPLEQAITLVDDFYEVYEQQLLQEEKQ